jgi:hypothetical protein
MLLPKFEFLSLAVIEARAKQISFLCEASPKHGDIQTVIVPIPLGKCKHGSKKW